MARSDACCAVSRTSLPICSSFSLARPSNTSPQEPYFADSALRSACTGQVWRFEGRLLHRQGKLLDRISQTGKMILMGLDVLQLQAPRLWVQGLSSERPCRTCRL